MALVPSFQQQQGTGTPSRRPRAFGRTSNVWQYVESVQERLVPAISHINLLASPGDQLRRTSLDFAEGDEDDDGSDDGANGQSGRRGDNQFHRGRQDEQLGRHRQQRKASHTTNSTLGWRAGATDSDPSSSQDLQLPKRKYSKALMQASSNRYKRSSKGGIRSVGSLPELHTPISTTGGDITAASRSIGVIAATRLGSAKRMLATGTSAASSTAVLTTIAPVPSPNAKRNGAATTAFNSTEIIRRLQALGTSASTPVLSIATPSGAAATTHAGTSQPASSTTTTTSSDVKSALLGAPGLVPPAPTTSGSTVLQPAGGGATASAIATVVGVTLSDAEKLRNDFNSQPSKLYYGCSVAFELFNGHLMMVGSPDGQVRVQSLEKLQIPQIKGCKDRAIYTIVDLTDVHSANTICYGDAVWLQLSVGTGDVSWEQGGVLGAQVREAPQLRALALSHDPNAIRNGAQAPAVVGHPVPLRAYLPKSREDGDTQADEIQSRVRNKSSRMLGKWIIRSAVMRSRHHKDHFVYNNDEIYLEQDWFYLGADSDAGVAVLRQLPPVTALSDVPDGAYVIERRAAWRIRLLDSTAGGTGLSLAQQQMERLLLRAKMQLKQSKKMRAGECKTYGPDLHSGAGFPQQLRAKIVEMTHASDAQSIAQQDRRIERLADHLQAKADAMNRQHASIRDRDDAGDATGDAEMLPRDFMLSEEAADRAADRSAAASTGSRSNSSNSATTESLSSQQAAPSGDRSDDTSAVEEEREVNLSDETPHVCALCQSSTIGYNLCSQLHRVMVTMESKAKGGNDTSMSAQRQQSTRTSNSSNSTRRTSRTLSHVAAVGSVVDTTKLPHAMTVTTAAAAESRQQQKSEKQRYKQRARAERTRLLALFAHQDATMHNILEFQERTTRDALIAQEHARIGFSPVATHFRDRFKHVGLLAQAHMAMTHVPPDIADLPQHGISGHFYKLHAALFQSESAANRQRRGRKSDSHVEQLAQSLGIETFAFDMRMCPIEPLGDGYDVFGNCVDTEASDVLRPTRMFPTASELAVVAPVDTKQLMDTYGQNRAAVIDMLDGYAELCDTHIRPTLQQAVAMYDRTVLVEMLEFTARASEFVCARRVQVHVAQLLHVVAESELGDVDALDAPFDALLHEIDATLAFVRFFREHGATKKKRK